MGACVFAVLYSGVDLEGNHTRSMRLSRERASRGNFPSRWSEIQFPNRGDQSEAEFFFKENPLLEAAIAIQDYNLSDLQKLILKMEDIDTSGKFGITLLSFSYLEGNMEAMKILLENGASPDKQIGCNGLPFSYSKNDDHTLLSVASVDGTRPLVFEKLLPCSKRPERVYYRGMTLLHFILEFRPAVAIDEKLLREIVEYGVDVNALDSYGRTAREICREYAPDLLADFDRVVTKKMGSTSN
jgi:ankyrin repeat protein